MTNPLSRLNIRARMLVVLIIFMVPIGILGYKLNEKLTESIEFSTQEAKGAQFVKPLLLLINSVVDYEIAHVQQAAGVADAPAEMKSNGDTTDALITELEKLDAMYGADLDFTSEGLKKHGQPDVTVANLKSKWTALKAKTDYVEADYTSIIDDLLAMIKHTGDASNLILDGDLDSYYIVDATFNVFPKMLKNLATIKTLGFTALNTGAGTLDSKTNFEIATIYALLNAESIPHAHDSITTALKEDANFNGVLESFQTNVTKALADFDEKGKGFNVALSGLLQSGTMDAGAFVTMIDDLHDATGDMAVPLMDELVKMLDIRIQALKDSRTKIMVQCAILLVIAYLMFFFVSGSISKPIKRIQLTLEKISEAETDMEIPVTSGKDEISRLYAAAEKLRATVEDAFRLKQMVDTMPINVITVDVRNDFKVNYMNNTSVSILKTLQEHLPVKVDDMLGKSFDIFHKNPEHQRRMVGNPANLPHRAKIKVGPETLDLSVSAVNNKKGEYISAMLTWMVVTKQVALADNFESSVKSVVTEVSASAEQMRGNAERLSTLAGETKSNSGIVASSATEAAQTATQVAAAAEELTAAIGEISSQVQKSSAVASQASHQAENINQSMHSLVEKSNRVGEVIQFITNIASQINLLALNATIESARAGEAGRGFAVVASEVKNLANQTAKATEEIVQQVQSMQEATKGAVQSVSEIISIINEISQSTAGVAAAVEEQSAATNEISRNIAHTAQGTNEISRSIVAVEQGADETGTSSRQVLDSAKALSGQSALLSEKVDEFLRMVRAS